MKTPQAPRALIFAAVGASTTIALLWFVAGYPTVIYDSFGYYYLANVLRTTGLSQWPAALRTYGYPFFQLAVTGFRELPAEEFRLIVFAAQLALYLVACGLMARRLARILDSPRAGTVAFAIGALNPVLLLHTTEPLSDLVSAVLVLLALVYTWRVPDAGPARSLGDAGLAFFCAGASAVVRPANVVVVPALGAAWLLRGIRWRDVGWRQVGAAFAGLLPPFLPQVIINYRASGSLSPLITGGLYRLQAGWGMGALKYATLVMPDRSPFLVYTNPLYRGDPTPLAFLRHHPVEYVTTLFIHGFAMIDQDLPFTYVTDLAPWYRWPLAVVNFASFYFALAAFALAVARFVRRRALDEGAFVVASTALVAGAYFLLYLPVEVESRFGLVPAILTTPLIVAGLTPFAGRDRKDARTRKLVLAGAPLAVVAAVCLSVWIEKHRTNPYVDSPANAFVMNPKRASPPSRN